MIHILPHRLAIAVLLASCWCAALTQMVHARRLLVETDATFYVDATGASRGAGVSTAVSWNTFCEFVLPFLLERGYEPPAYWCN